MSDKRKQRFKLDCGHTVNVHPVYDTYLGDDDRLLIRCDQCPPEGERASGAPAFPQREAIIPDRLKGWWLIALPETSEYGYRDLHVTAIRPKRGDKAEATVCLKAHYDPEKEQPCEAASWYLDSPWYVTAFGDVDEGVEDWFTAIRPLTPWGLHRFTKAHEFARLLTAAGAKWGKQVPGWRELVKARAACLVTEAEARGETLTPWAADEAAEYDVPRYVEVDPPEWAAPPVEQEEEVAA